jgi:hypothetical protein
MIIEPKLHIMIALKHPTSSDPVKTSVHCPHEHCAHDMTQKAFLVSTEISINVKRFCKYIFNYYSPTKFVASTKKYVGDHQSGALIKKETVLCPTCKKDVQLEICTLTGFVFQPEPIKTPPRIGSELMASIGK